MILIKGANIINEEKIFQADVLIDGDRIQKIGEGLSIDSDAGQVIDAHGLYLIPGMIDDQVHFREPGLTHKANIETESRAAVAGGITSFIEMPNTKPQATTVEELEKKFERAAETSWANYSFMMGTTNDNLQEILKVDKQKVAGLKIFLGSSTGNMLVDDPEVLEEIFRKTDLRISVHCEDEATILENTRQAIEQYGEDIPVQLHPEIRSAEACYKSSSKAIELAKKTGARLHVFHLSSAKEMDLFDSDIPLEEKKITAEVCIHHLWFSEEDYKAKGTHIKWNPAVKKASDRKVLWEALLDDRIDVIATDHAPHTLEEKDNVYTKAPSGGPLVQHALVALLECHHQGKISLERIVRKACHNPAIMFEIADRGFIKEGYKADLVLFDLNAPWEVSKDNVLYKCGWSPFEGETFQAAVTHTLINGELAYQRGEFPNRTHGERLTFNR
ncbi:dihydroorotase [Aureitalea marina]|uniref:Dihydroorotase n=1 Tax=Aureitalea marina TaxID=930804 RepID=A0A2S7KT74_9FLAO|nr:dihydroorotase [Aureitalea marina]PQB05829.1 dihydroorotase [Aureitalea marina]